jgi:hypothetical protein
MKKIKIHKAEPVNSNPTTRTVLNFVKKNYKLKDDRVKMLTVYFRKLLSFEKN